MGWTAIAYGALRVHGLVEQAKSIELLLLPVFPTEQPIGLSGNVANLWMRIVHGPVEDDQLSDSDLQLIKEFEEFGIASNDEGHPSRITKVFEPWFESPMHELVTSLVSCVARDNQVKCLIIKGPKTQKQGLRQRAHSGDVDVWVEPSRVKDLQEALAPWGWRTKPEFWEGTSLIHSKTVVPSTWGSEIDIHKFIPGIGVSEAEAFEIALSESDRSEFASVWSITPNPNLSAIILCLNLIRPEPDKVVTEGSLRLAITALRSRGDSIIQLTRFLECDGTLHQVLSECFPERSMLPFSPVPLNWSWRGKESKPLSYLEALRISPLNEKLTVLRRIIWPRKELVIDSARRAGVFSSNKLIIELRLERIKRGIRRMIER